MSDAYAAPDSTPFSDSPDASSAAQDLRAAAEGKSSSSVSTMAEEKTSALKEAAAQKAAQIRDFAGEKAQNLKAAASGKLGSRIDAMRGGAGDTASHLKDAASESWQDSQAKARELHESLETYVRENPTKAVLSAVGVGFVLGLLIRR